MNLIAFLLEHVWPNPVTSYRSIPQQAFQVCLVRPKKTPNQLAGSFGSLSIDEVFLILIDNPDHGVT